MGEVNKDLLKYIETEILPIYENNDSGHGINHIKYVLNRCLMFSKQFSDIDINMISLKKEVLKFL